MKKDIYKVAIIGFGHVHINDVAAHFANNQRIDLCCCADTEPLVPELKEGPYTRKWNLEFVKKNFHIKRVYDDYKEMIAKEALDLAVVNSENAYHVEITEECAKRNIAVCIEKPMATNLSDGLKMYRSILTYGSELMVNWPLTWNPAMHKIKSMIDSGEIGQLIELKTRMGHTGPLGPGAKHKGVSQTAAVMTDMEKARTWWHQSACGGGAMVDYCCYGTAMCAWFIGKSAVAAMGMRLNSITRIGDVEDNSCMFLRFDDCYAVLEGTWTTFNHGFSTPIIYGTNGTLIGNYKNQSLKFIDTKGVEHDVALDPLPDHLSDVAAAYVHHMDTGEPLHITQQPEFNLRALAMLDAGVRSAGSGKMEITDNICWKIG